jgi:uncharacterized protein (DUF1697 family)
MTASRYVALLRGINLGSRNRIAMGPLRELVESLGYTDVKTHLQSGNVVFSGKRKAPTTVARDVERAIEGEFGLAVGVVVRTADELAEVVGKNPMGDREKDPAKLVVTFLSAAPAAGKVKAIDAERFAPDEFQVVGREIYQWLPRGVHPSKLTNDFWQQQLGVTATARNWNTVTKLLGLATS